MYRTAIRLRWSIASLPTRGGGVPTRGGGGGGPREITIELVTSSLRTGIELVVGAVEQVE